MAKILVVDSEQHVRESLSTLLVDEGFEVDTADSGREALEKLVEDGFDIALLDIKIPGMSDVELLGSLRQEHPGVDVIMMTGFATVDEAVGALKLGAYDLLHKPFDNAEILASVGSCMEKRKLAEERKWAEEALRESEERLQDFLNNANDLIQSVDPDGRLVYVNRKWRETLGYAEEEIAGLSLFDIICPDSQAHCMEVFQRVIAGEKVDHVEANFVTKDGRTIMVEGSVNCRFEDGKPVATRGLFRDITERKRAEEVLRESEEISRGMLESAANGMYIVQGGKFQYVSPLVEAISGYTSDELIGAYSLEYVHPDDIELVRKKAIENLKGQSKSPYEFRFIRKDGEPVWILEKVASIRYRGERAAVGGFLDITERKQAEEALRESRESFHNIVEKSTDAVLIVDGGGIVRFVNPAVVTMFGRDEKELLGEMFGFPAVAGGSMDVDIIRRGGEIGVGEMRVAKTTWEGEVAHLILLRDMTERRQAEQELRRKKAELEERNMELKRASRLKSEFLANMSHELRTPLNAIMGYTSLMSRQRYGTVTEKQAKALERVDLNARNLISLISNILDLSKIEAGKMPLYNEEVDLKELVEEVVSTVEPMVNEAKLTLETAMAEDIPTIWTDRSKLKQIILNLLSNAIKFTSKGGVTVSAWGSDRHVKVAVKDTGIGIREEDLEVIFEEFRQADGSETREQGGTGIGLTIAKKFANLLGGDIEAESVYGQGSTFTITMSCSSPPQEQIDIPEPIAEVPVRPATTTKTLLMIDDDPEMVALVRENLSNTDYHVIGALTGEEGIKMAVELQPFAITLDILMPHMDGWYVIQRLKSEPKTADIPIIIMSILEEKALAYSLGVADYVVKPVERDLLMTKLRRLEASGRK